jgi:O-antigen ligase
MDALSFAGPIAAAWTVALVAGAVAGRVPVLGLPLGALGFAFTLSRRRLPATVWVAALGAVLFALLLPWAALTRDPFRALPATAGWPVASAAFAMLGAGAAVWSWIGKLPTISSQAAVPASAGIRRALLLELGALALLLPVSIAGTQIALAATTATLLFGYLRGARARLTTLLDLPIAAVLVAALLSAAFSASPTSPFEVTALRTLLAFYVVTRTLGVTSPSERELGRLVAVWAGASALVSAMAFAQHWWGFDALAVLHLRSPVYVLAPESPGHLAGIGTFTSRLTFAHATAITLATLLGLQLAGGPRWLSAALAIEAAGIWSTFARAAWFALAAVGAAGLSTAGWLGDRARALRWLAVLGGALALLFALSPGTRARARAGLSFSANDDRLFIWARAAQVTLDHPVLGVGFGSYHLVLGPYYDRFNPQFPMRTWAHDMPLSMLCETGPLGLFALLWLLVDGLALALKALRRPEGAPQWRGLALGGALATLAFAVVSAFHDALYDGQVGYNLFFSLALAAWATVQLRQSASQVEMPAGLP